MELSITCSKRDLNQKPNAIRRGGRLPAVLYGHNGDESLALTVDTREADFLVRDASINNTLVTVDVPDLPWKGKALIREVQSHPWKSQLLHLSFFSVAAQDSVEVVVPLNYVGTAKGVRDEGGILDTIVTELAITCPPSDIPESIDVDVEALGVGESLHVGDLNLPKGVEAVADDVKVAVTVAAPRTVAAAEDSGEVVVQSPADVPLVGEES
ncbi:MAG: 50S ribosomal protein L25/general stress protein Ctc [Cyanobacteria bacterium P01_H01_bin.119]